MAGPLKAKPSPNRRIGNLAEDERYALCERSLSYLGIEPVCKGEGHRMERGK